MDNYEGWEDVWEPEEYEDQEPEGPDPDIDSENIYTEFKTLQRQGVINYILPTDPLGEEWVIGTHADGILKLIGNDQAMAYLAGVKAVVVFFAKRQGLI